MLTTHTPLYQISLKLSKQRVSVCLIWYFKIFNTYWLPIVKDLRIKKSMDKQWKICVPEIAQEKPFKQGSHAL